MWILHEPSGTRSVSDLSLFLSYTCWKAQPIPYKAFMESIIVWTPCEWTTAVYQSYCAGKRPQPISGPILMRLYKSGNKKTVPPLICQTCGKCSRSECISLLSTSHYILYVIIYKLCPLFLVVKNTRLSCHHQSAGGF